MKQLTSLFLAGAMGGLVTLGGIRLLDRPVDSPSDNASFNRQVSLTGAPLPFDFTAAAARSMPSVVSITARESKESALNRSRESDPFRFFFGEDFESPFLPYAQPQQGTGSGVIYSEDGYIVTNNHVIEFADEVEVTLFDNRTFKAKVVGTYPKSDLAVLKIEASGLPTLEIADSDEAQVGEWVLAVGNPLELTSTVTAGIISAKGRDINIIDANDAIESFIQTDAAVNPGNSGGALVDAEGRWLGVNTAISTRTGFFQGYSFAIPVSVVTKIADDIIQYGTVQRAYLGVNIRDLNSVIAEEMGVDLTQGVIVESLQEGGSAQYAGVLPKDIITAVNGRAIKSVPELQEIVGRAKLGETLDLTVVRNGKPVQLPVVLR